jgi:hypothetical protein
MNFGRWMTFWTITLLLLNRSASFCHDSPMKSISPEKVREELAYTVGVQAYIYGYPLVEMYRVRHSRVFDPNNKDRVGLNQFLHARKLRNHNDTLIVAPNHDTLYSSAWLDLAHEPVVLQVPDTNGRYYVVQFLDFYTNNFAFVGKRSTGTKAGVFVITGPDWKGTLPDGVRRIDSPTNSIWLLARILVDEKDDLDQIHALQDQFSIVPWSGWGKKKPFVNDPRKPELVAYDATEPLRFFEFLNAALKENPPPATDRGLISLFRQIHVGPDKSFKLKDLDEPTIQGLRRALEMGEKMVCGTQHAQKKVNGWVVPQPNIAKFNDDYLYRAFIAKAGLASLSLDEGINFWTGVDDRGETLHGSRKYILRFAKNETPPVDGFWSLTMYGPKGLLVANPIDRYAISDRTKGIQRDPNGGLTFYLQKDSPGKDREANWLPCPKDEFTVWLRCYLQHKSVTEGKWKAGAIQRVD